MMHKVLPGDLVTFNEDSERSASLVNDCRRPPKRSVFIQGDEARKLQQMWIAEKLMSSLEPYIVVCASMNRAMVMHPTGQLLVTKVQFLKKLSG